MKIILQINGFLELLAGFALIFKPDLLLWHHQPEIQGIAIAKLYGILAFCFGLLSFVLSKHFQYNTLFKHIILIITAFHFVVGLYMFGLYNQQITPHPGAFLVHLLMAIFFVMIYLKNIQKLPQGGKSTP